MPEPPQGSWFPKAGLLKSPNRPLGKSSQEAALLSSPFPASVVAFVRETSPEVASFEAEVGVIKSPVSCGLSVRGSGISLTSQHGRTKRTRVNSYCNKLVVDL